MAPFITTGGFTFTTYSVGGKWSWTVQSNNIQNAGQIFQVIDITSPFGRLGDVFLPIPSDVVISMANSLSQFQQQLVSLLTLVSPAISIFSATMTEGDPITFITNVPIQNSGAFGSFMTVTSAPDVPWLISSPSTIAGIGKNDQGVFAISSNPGILLATGSPFIGYVNLSDGINPSIPITINLTVLPRPAFLLAPLVINFTYSVSLNSHNSPQVLTVTNSGPATSILNFTVAKVQNNSPWLSFTPLVAGPIMSSASVNITFSLNIISIPLSTGVYQETIKLNSLNASNNPISIVVTLTVLP